MSKVADEITITLTKPEIISTRFAIRQMILKADRNIEKRMAKLGDAYDPEQDQNQRRLEALESIFRKLGFDPEEIEVVG